MEKGLFYGFLVIGLLLVGATGVFFLLEWILDQMNRIFVKHHHHHPK